MSEAEIRPGDIRGLDFFKPIQALLERLHTLHDSPNRKLHYDQYVSLLLLYYFNPVLTSLRGLQQASTLENVQRALRVPRASLGSLSEAAHIFDANVLRQIFQALSDQAFRDGIDRPTGVPQDLRLLAVDGSLWEFLPRMAAYFWRDGPRSGPPPGFKVHVHFDLLKGAPVRAEVTDGYASESRQLERMIEPGALYVFDRGLFDFILMQNIVDAGSSFVVRAYERTVYEEVQALPLSTADLKAGVYSDVIARIGSEPHAGKLHRNYRIIKARVLLPRQNGLNPKRSSGSNRCGIRDERPMELVLVTDRLDLSAEDVLKLYRYRWHIEIFFRWMKCSMRFKHLLSECDNGFALQLYSALIATLLIMLWTNKKPKLRTFELVQLHLAGWASQDEMLRHLSTLKTPAK